MPLRAWLSPRASAHPHLRRPVVCGVRLGPQRTRAWGAPLGVAVAAGISAPALGMSRCLRRSPRAS
eukprot:12631409-Alexandrium_andersonii.AAC.1